MDKQLATQIVQTPTNYPPDLVQQAVDYLNELAVMKANSGIEETPLEPLSPYEQRAMNRRFPRLKKLYDIYMEQREQLEPGEIQFSFSQYCEVFHAIPQQYTANWCQSGDCG